MTPVPSALPVEDLVAHLRGGGAALFPTDTLPALACRPQVAHRLWQLKARPADKPLILMGADLEQLRQTLAVPWEAAWLEQARRCWPGPFTLVLPIRGPLTDWLHPGGLSLGLRVPDCAIARDLLHSSGPLATTSANLSGQPAALDDLQASAQFPALPLLAPLPWPAGSGQASAVLAWRPPSPEQPSGGWQTLRPSEPGSGGGQTS